MVPALTKADMASSIPKGLITIYGIEMASTFYEREINVG